MPARDTRWFFWKVSVKCILVYWIYEYYLNQGSIIIYLKFSLHNIEEANVLICIKKRIWNVSTKSTCHRFAKLSFKYMKIQHQLKLIIISSWWRPGMTMIPTFHYLVIIYQNFNEKTILNFLKNQPILNIFFNHFFI